MQSLIHNILLIAMAVVCLSLGACISSPLPGGTVGALYQWGDLDSPVVTLEGKIIPGLEGYYDGDFSLAELPVEHPELLGEDDQPWLFEACNENQCYSIILFAEDFDRNIGSQFQGDASMNVFSTLMANEVRGLPADQVRPALDMLSAQLTLEGVADYTAFVAIDLRREKESREVLLYPELYAEAEALQLSLQTATVTDLLGQETRRTDDLIVSSEFDFDSSWELSVDVDLVSWHDVEAYLLICSDFESNNDGYTVDYASCPLKAPLQSGVWQGRIQLTGITEEMIAVILPLLNPDEPEYRLWQRKVDGDMFIVR